MKFIMIERRILYFLLFLMLILPDGYSQNSTSSPFSIFGIGEIETRSFGRNAGMGNVETGFQSDNYINRSNPAALSGIDTLRFIIDVSAAIKFSELTTSSLKNRTTDFNFKSLAAGVRLNKRWTGSVGLSPYSNVGYNIRDRQHVRGTFDDYRFVMFSGSGGVNKFYWANAFELFRGFSVGITSSYYFGNITHNEDTEVFSIVTTHNISKISFDFGLLYKHRFGDHTNVTVGGTYNNEAKYSIQRSKMITSSTALELSERLPDLKSYIPESYGAGFSISRNKKNAEWILAADYKYQNWSVDKTRDKKWTYSDSHIYSAGLQFTPNTRRTEKYIQAMRFQVGTCYNRSYLKVNGFQVEDYSVSLGVGLPFNNSSYVNIAAIAGESQTGKRGGITERYVLLSVNLSLIDRWFAKYQWN